MEETVTLKKNDKSAPPAMPKIVVCPDYKSLKLVQAEFVAAFGAFAVGVVIITLDEAVRLELPIREAVKSYEDGKQHEIYLANTVKELIPTDYKDSGYSVDIVKLASDFSRSKPQRNDSCPCGSEKKFKNCCITL